MVNSPVSGSFTTEAVKPAAEEALPLVYTARGCNEQTYLRSHVSNQLLCDELGKLTSRTDSYWSMDRQQYRC